MKRRFSGWDESPRRFYFLIIMDSRFLYKTKIFSGDSLGGMAGRIQVRRAYKKERLRLLLQGLRHKETECKNGYSNFWFAPRTVSVLLMMAKPNAEWKISDERGSAKHR